MLTVKDVFERANKYAVNSLGVAVQTYHETGNYRHYRDFNLAGIKCTPSWVKKGRKCWTARTQEHNGKTYVDIIAGFRSYVSLDDFLEDYSSLIFRLYQKSWQNIDNVFGYFAGLHGKWATSPVYFKSLVRMLFQLAPILLTVWDPGEELRVAISRGVLADWQIAEIRKYDLTPFGVVSPVISPPEPIPEPEPKPEEAVIPVIPDELPQAEGVSAEFQKWLDENPKLKAILERLNG